MKEHELYGILGVAPNATEAEIKGAFRNLAKRYHPDAAGAMSSSEMFSRVASAYRVLCVRNRKGSLLDSPVRKPSRRRPKTGPFGRNAQRQGGPGQPMGAASSRAGQPARDIFQLGRTLISSKSPSLRAFAAGGLGNSGKKSSYAYLRRALNDSSEVVLKSVIKAIGDLKVYQSAGELGALFLHSNEDIKCTILQTVDRLGSPRRFNNILVAAMKDDDFNIRRTALQLFARQRG